MPNLAYFMPKYFKWLYCCSTGANYFNLIGNVCTLGRLIQSIVFSFPPSWILDFGVSSHSQSHELQKLKWHLRSKDHVSHWMGKIIYAAVSTREKGCFVALRPLELDANPHFVGFLLQMNTKTSLIDGCLSCILLQRSSIMSSVQAL